MKHFRRHKVQAQRDAKALVGSWISNPHGRVCTLPMSLDSSCHSISSGQVGAQLQWWGRGRAGSQIFCKELECKELECKGRVPCYKPGNPDPKFVESESSPCPPQACRCPRLCRCGKQRYKGDQCPSRHSEDLSSASCSSSEMEEAFKEGFQCPITSREWLQEGLRGLTWSRSYFQEICHIGEIWAAVQEGQAGTLTLTEGAGSLRAKRDPKVILPCSVPPSRPATAAQILRAATSEQSSIRGEETPILSAHRQVCRC